MSDEKQKCACEGEECNCEHEHHDCDCGCGEDDLVILQDQDGNDVKFHYVYNLEHEGKEYVFLQSAEEEDDETIEIFAVETVEENGEFFDTLDPVDDDLYEVLYEKLLLVASEDACEDDDCECHDEGCDCHNKK